MRILAACAIAVSLLQPVQHTRIPAAPPQDAGGQASAAQAPAAVPAAGSSNVWIGRYEELERFLLSVPPVAAQEQTGVVCTRRGCR